MRLNAHMLQQPLPAGTLPALPRPYPLLALVAPAGAPTWLMHIVEISGLPKHHSIQPVPGEVQTDQDIRRRA